MKKLSTLFLMTLLAASLHAQRSEYLLEKNWKFMKGEAPEAMKPEFDDRKWETVTVLASDGIVLGSMPPSINRRHLSLMVP